jgi:hypothetical protein
MRTFVAVVCFSVFICVAASPPLEDFTNNVRFGSLPNPKYTPGFLQTPLSTSIDVLGFEVFFHDYSGKLCTPQDPYFEGHRYPCKLAYCTRHVTEALKRTVAAYYGQYSLLCASA